MKKRNVPEIRFKGFSDDWEQYKLKDIANKVNEKNVNLSVLETFTNSAEYGVINQRDFFDHDISNVENIGGYYIVGEDNFVYNPRISVTAPVGPINRNKLGRKGIMSPIYTIFRTHDIDPVFLEYFFKGNTWYSYMYFNGDTGARFDRFSIKNEVFFDMPIPYPQFEEQKLIGRYLDYLDCLLTLYQHKYEKLKLFKEAMLDKLFPKNDEKVPEIRFKGFTDDWKQHKLGEIVERVVRKNTNNESNLPLTISAQYGLVDQITYFNHRVASRDVSNYYLVLNGEFVYNKSTSDSFPFGSVKRLDLYEKGVLSTLYIVFSIKNQEDTNSNFLTVFFDTDRWHKGISERAAEGARNHGLLNISAKDFFDIDLYLPKNKKEQAAIGVYFKNLDHLINLHKHKYEKLKLFKQAMLDKMLI